MLFGKFQQIKLSHTKPNHTHFPSRRDLELSQELDMLRTQGNCSWMELKVQRWGSCRQSSEPLPAESPCDGQPFLLLKFPLQYAFLLQYPPWPACPHLQLLLPLLYESQEMLLSPLWNIPQENNTWQCGISELLFLFLALLPIFGLSRHGRAIFLVLRT